MSLTTKHPLMTRLIAWSNERFPASHSILFFVLYSTGLLTGRALTSGAHCVIRGQDLLGFLAAVSFFLMLRVFDEHKDYELDRVNHPNRVLQSGLITLRHLKIMGGVAIAIQFLISMVFDGGLSRVTAIWALVMVWSTLMAFEFFCGEWLEKRLVLYAVSHMLVMPMALIWMAQMGANTMTLPTDIGWLAASSFFSGASFEVTRKLKAPEDERDTIDSYTKSLGLKAAPLVVIGLLVCSALSLSLLLYVILNGAMSHLWYLALAAPILFASYFLLKFRRQPSSKAVAQCEGVVALAMLSGYGVILYGVWTSRTLEWALIGPG